MDEPNRRHRRGIPLSYSPLGTVTIAPRSGPARARACARSVLRVAGARAERRAPRRPCRGVPLRAPCGACMICVHDLSAHGGDRECASFAASQGTARCGRTAGSVPLEGSEALHAVGTSHSLWAPDDRTGNCPVPGAHADGGFVKYVDRREPRSLEPTCRVVPRDVFRGLRMA